MKAVVYGGGNIGRGFLGQLLYESGFETVFIDVNQEMIDKINTDKSYPIKIICNEYQKEILIKNVRAVQWTGSNVNDVREFIPDNKIQRIGFSFETLQIATLEGVMDASPGDYVIKGIKNEFYPCKSDIFKDSYDEVDE